MLVLTRKTGEAIVLGDPRKPLAVVTVVSVRGEKVRIRTDAPTSLAVNRSEVAKEIVEKRRDGAGAGGGGQ